MRVPLIVPPLLLSVALAGCGGNGGPPGASPAPSGGPDPTPAARADLAARAAAAQDLVGVALYAYTPPGFEEGTPTGAGGPSGDPSASPAPGDRTIMVVRAADGSWRVDVPGGALGGTVDVSIVTTADGMYHCTLATEPEPGGCVPVEALPAAADPRVQHVFTDWPDVLTDRSAAVAVAHAPVPDGLPGGGEEDGRCFAVQPSSASLLAPLDGGVYCYRPDGTLTGARLGLGDLTLVSADPAAPPTVELPGPVVPGGDPLPTATPTPSPTPSPAGSSDAGGIG